MVMKRGGNNVFRRPSWVLVTTISCNVTITSRMIICQWLAQGLAWWTTMKFDNVGKPYQDEDRRLHKLIVVT